MATAILKVSVLADGRVLLDGNPVTIEALAGALDAAPKGDTKIWYYRENAAGEPPPTVMQVMKAITQRRLPIRMSTKPDFSDEVGPDQMGIGPVFAVLRQRAAQRQLAILRPDGKPMLLPAMAREAAPPDAVAAVEKMLPSSTQRNIAVIGDTSWTMIQTPSVKDANGAIPFFGMLMGFAAIGHAVWIFDGSTPATLAAGCREADVVIVDSARAEAFPANWQNMVTQGMRGKQVLLHDRATFQLRKA